MEESGEMMTTKFYDRNLFSILAFKIVSNFVTFSVTEPHNYFQRKLSSWQCIR